MSLTLRGISKRFGALAAVENVDLDVPTGALLALLGPSGCGKTTLLRIMAGLELAETGRVFIDGADATDWPARDRRVGFVFQHYALFGHMTVAENVAFGLSVRPRRTRPKAAAIQNKVAALLDLVQLGAVRARYPQQLSGGQRQRVALARALAVEPRLLLLDEPFGALDSQVRQELRRWLRKLHDELHVTSIFVTHDQQEAIEVADRIVVLNRGRVEQAGQPGEVYDAPASAFVHRFLGQVNELPVTWRLGRAHVGPVDISDRPGHATDNSPSVALVRPHELDIAAVREKAGAAAGGASGWHATVVNVRVIGPIVRVGLAADGRGAEAPLEAEISRERFDAEQFRVGQRVCMSLRRWQLYPA
jgi:sulfate transport system ATP-binding protein